MLRRELETYRVELNLDLCRDPIEREPVIVYEGEAQSFDQLAEQVPHLWDDHTSIFTFDPNMYMEYLRADMNRAGEEQKLDDIIKTMIKKWDRMDRFWFQKNRHLDWKVKKKTDIMNKNN